ncbi:MAG: hypothetical protein KIG36_05680 [Eubacteriales bacterium]|nr:hypothetical protein [Eubacteriales bacterium]
MLLIFATIALFIGSNLLIKNFQTRVAVGRLQRNLYNVIAPAAAFLLLLLLKGGVLSFNVPTLLLAVCAGFAMYAYYSAKVLAVSIGPLALVSMFYVLGGVLLPALYGYVVSGEPFKVTGALGLALVCASFVPLVVAQRRVSTEKLSARFIVCGVILFVLNGAIGCMGKIAQSFSPDPSWSMDFIGLYYLTYFFISLIPMAKDMPRYSQEDVSRTLNVRNLLLLAGAGATNAVGAAFNFSLLFRLPVSLQYPVIQSSLMVGVTLLSFLLYREKPTRPTVVSLCLAVASIILLSV